MALCRGQLTLRGNRLGGLKTCMHADIADACVAVLISLLKTIKVDIYKNQLFCDAPLNKLTWLVLGGDPAARSHRVEQFTAL